MCASSEKCHPTSVIKHVQKAEGFCRPGDSKSSLTRGLRRRRRSGSDSFELYLPASVLFDPEDLDELRLNTINPSFDMLYQQDCDAQRCLRSAPITLLRLPN